MPSPAELVAALSRAYALTDVFPAGDPVSTEALEHLRRLLRDGATVAVGVAGLRVDGIDVPDFHGRSGRFARDLRMLGVRELRFGAHHQVGDLERFVRSLRDDAVRGESAEVRAPRGSSPGEIVFVFEGDMVPETTSPEADPPSVAPAPREGGEGGRPGAGLVESIKGLFEGDPLNLLAASGEGPPEPGPGPEVEADPSLDELSHSIREPEPPVSPSPEGEFVLRAEDLEDEPELAPGEGSPGFVDPEPALVDSIRGLFDDDPTGTWEEEPPDPEVGDPFEDRFPGESPHGGMPATREGRTGDAAAPGALEGRGVVGEVSFGRRVHPELLDSPDSVREASFGSPDTRGGESMGGVGTSDTSWPFGGFRSSRGEGSTDGPDLRSGSLPSGPEAEAEGEGEGIPAPGEGDLGLFDFPVDGELSHPLSFLDEVPRSGLLDQELALELEPASRDLPPPEDETEVLPPEGAWDQLPESSPSEARSMEPPGSSRSGADGVLDGEQVVEEVGREDRSEVGVGLGDVARGVPLWERDPEIPVWHREEDEGSPPSPVGGVDGVDRLFHRVITGLDDHRRQAAEELRTYAGPTLNPLLLDRLSNGVLDLLRGAPGSSERARLPLDLARELATPGVTSRLVARLGQEKDREVRRELIVLFSRLGEPMARALVDALVEEADRTSRRTYLEALMGLGPEGVSAVNRMLNDPRWFVVRNGLTILGELDDEASAERVAPVLSHGDPRVRREAVATLARLGGEQADRIVEQRLSDPSPEVRSAAASGVGARRIGRALEALQGMLITERESFVLEAVMGALGALGDPSSIPALGKKASGSLLSRPPREIRIAAYRALHAIGTPPARSIVEAARKDRDPEVREALEGIVRSPPPG